MKITILGLGRMGRPIARNLMEDGHTVTLYRRRPERPVPEELAGARTTSSLADAVGGAQVVVSVVADDAAEEELTFGPDGLLRHLGPGAVHLCLTSIAPATSLRLAQAHQEAGQGYVAAPVLGSPRAAANRQVWFIAGGAEVHVVRCLGVLEALGRGVTRVGTRVDLAHALKLGAHAFSLAVIGALAEALAYGEKIGYSPSSFLRLLNLGQFKSPQADAWGALMVRHDHQPSDQTLDQAAHGLALLQASARELGLALPLADHLRGQLARAQREGLGELDVTALSMIFRREAGLPGPWAAPATPAQAAGALPPGPEAPPAPAAPAPAAPIPAAPIPTAPIPATTPAPSTAAAPDGGERTAAVAPVPERRSDPLPHAGGRGGRSRGGHPGRGNGSGGRGQERPTMPSRPAPEPAADSRPATPAAPAPPAPPPALPIRAAAPDPGPDPLPTWTQKPAWTWTRQVPLRGAEPPAPLPPVPAAAPAAAPSPTAPPAPAVAPASVPVAGPGAAAAPAPPEAPTAELPASEPDPNLYYEEDGGVVWGYHDGQHHPTPWLRLADAEFGVTEVTLVRVSRHRSLNPRAVQDFVPLFGGRSRVVLSDGQVLVLGREPTRKLKFILGV